MAHIQAITANPEIKSIDELARLTENELTSVGEDGQS